jgi:hypothetical protein
LPKPLNLTAPPIVRQALSLTDFANDYIKRRMELDRKKNLTAGGSTANIKAAMNSLHRFTQRDNLLFDDITPDFLDRYSHWLLTKAGRSGNGVKGRGLQLYLEHLNHLFRIAERTFNSKRERKIVIFNPLEDYPIPKPPAAKKRAITLAQMRQIRDISLQAGRVQRSLRGICLCSRFI